MSKVEDTIRDACAKAKAAGIHIERGPWATWEGETKVVAVCAIGAVLWANGELPHPGPSLEIKGLVKAACVALGVEPAWLRRFWMGFDRGHHGRIIDKDGKDIGEDEVCRLGLDLAAELVA